MVGHTKLLGKADEEWSYPENTSRGSGALGSDGARERRNYMGGMYSYVDGVLSAFMVWFSLFSLNLEMSEYAAPAAQLPLRPFVFLSLCSLPHSSLTPYFKLSFSVFGADGGGRGVE
jgi:hypothetical protein